MDSTGRIKKALAVANDTKEFVLGEGVLAQTGEVFKRFFGDRKAVLVADRNTWRVAGEYVFGVLRKAGVNVKEYIIAEEEFHAEWRYVEMVDRLLDGDFEGARHIETDPDYVETEAGKCFRPEGGDYLVAISVGSGTINDLCKLTSHHHHQSFLTVPTAASVDGYSSFGASITYWNSKQTFQCPAPVALVADVAVIAAAPKPMTAAGYADLAAKIPAGAEWMIADVVGSEPIIPDAWHVLQDVLDSQLSNPEGVAAGDRAAISDLFEGLTLSGFAMQAAQSSRPASCCDHLFSHILDMTHHRYHGKFQSHGFQVAIGTLTMCAVFDEFFKFDFSTVDADACAKAWPTLAEEQERALDIFSDFPSPRLGYEQITMKYSDADGVREELFKVKAVWPELKAKLQGQVYPFKKMQRLFRIVGAPSDPSMIGITRHCLHDMFPKVQLMRYRYNVLDLGKRAGFYDKLAEGPFLPGAAWDLGDEQPIL